MDALGWNDVNMVSPQTRVRKIIDATQRSPSGSKVSRLRKIKPEAVFGRVKEDLRFRQFYRRGIEFKSEWAPVCSTLNILKAIGMGFQSKLGRSK